MPVAVFGFDWDLTLFPVSTDDDTPASDVLESKLGEIELSVHDFNAYVSELKTYLTEMTNICAKKGWYFFIVTRNSEANVRYLLKEVVHVNDSRFVVIAEPSRAHNKAELARIHLGPVSIHGAVMVLVDDSEKELKNAAAQVCAWNEAGYGVTLHNICVAKPCRGALYKGSTYGLMNQSDVCAQINALIKQYGV